MKVTGIYLAAGSSERMGTNKLALKLRNKEIGIWGLEKAIESTLQDIILLSTASNLIDLSGLCTKKLLTIQISSRIPSHSLSLKTGLQHAISLQADAVVILLADQPFITTYMINHLIDLFKRNPSCFFVASSFRGSIQPPILIAKKLFSSLFHLHGDQGARQILKKITNKGILVPFHEEKLFVDIDLMTEYLFWKKQIERK